MEINSQLIIERLSLRMDLDRIYFFKYQFLNQEHHHLLLALKPVSGLSTKALKPIVELCLMDQENITYEIVLIGDLKSKIKIGSIYYAYASLPKHIIFLLMAKITSCRDIKNCEVHWNSLRNIIRKYCLYRSIS